ncbi:MAG: MmcQ/YjbR family DNA-binding protein [Acutalibacteraceae bacterium]|jgi:predicted DNA-binding protein (MmcQ/YjbR family)
MTQKDVIRFCLSLPESAISYPYGDQPAVMKVLGLREFCEIYENASPLHLVMKCDPDEAQFLRSVYPAVRPGYHCNKTYWNSVFVDGTIPDSELKSMILHSYRLALQKIPKKQRPLACEVLLKGERQ